MDGIMIWRGDKTESDYIKVWLKHGLQEMYLTDYDIADCDELPDKDIFLQGGPKLLIKW